MKKILASIGLLSFLVISVYCLDILRIVRAQPANDEAVASIAAGDAIMEEFATTSIELNLENARTATAKARNAYEHYYNAQNKGFKVDEKLREAREKFEYWKLIRERIESVDINDREIPTGSYDDIE